ncbi:hypothetical protein S40285_01293 [Stachybotrys chlorohalonatus IBT 40285]|uniref:O-methylsterigmatocystin oxidoreductase n=1 Tax=Stachybotrys chlorohalonatus (strain IBT 40285) TaxID=1283841 RepID=A0A084QQW0_STAC4|nr:hypothetical protein S40285_01293 [Stachybotrys chlorohalonata IBT 40285]
MDSPVLLTVGTGIVALGVVGSVYNAFRSTHQLPRPPGPKGYPLLGNIADMPGPDVLETEHWEKHKAKYGPISSVTILGMTMVIINDPKIAIELFEKRSTKYSSRPKSYFAGEMIGWENALGLAPYNHQFRVQRKSMGRVIGSKTSAANFSSLQEEEVGHFLLHVLDEPSNSISHIRRMAGAVMLKIAYGYNVDPFHDDALVNMAGEVVTVFVQNALPFKWAVDMIPSLRFLPDWFPGTGFKQAARKWKAELDHVIDLPYAFVKHQMAEGKDSTSFLAQLIEQESEDPELKALNKWAASVLFSGGVDTTVASITWCHLAMTLYPEAQKKAQEEIDRVVGSDRLPTLADRENMPYIQALIKEVLRWHPGSPLGIPHTSTQDDVYNGYFIPKGSILLPNVGHFASDPNTYDDPEVFRPERFLPTDGREPPLDPRSYVFGFGRRLCPGQYLAENALFLNISQTLAVFNISKKVVDGKVIEPVISFSPGGISHPKPFANDIRPRSAHHEKLIRSLEDKYPWRESDKKIMDSLKI